MAKRVKLDNFEPTKTQQHNLEQADLNFIMQRYRKTGILPPGTTRTALYGDFSRVDDYLQAMSVLETARNQFAELPAKARKHYRNDPGVLLSAVEQALAGDKARVKELQELGLLNEEPKPNEEPPKQPAPKEGGA